jgi:hypothetical protein
MTRPAPDPALLSGRLRVTSCEATSIAVWVQLDTNIVANQLATFMQAAQTQLEWTTANDCQELRILAQFILQP